MNDLDEVPDYPPRVLCVFWTAGEDPVLEAPGWADWEVAAVLRELLDQFDSVTEEETQEP